jgi:RNA polymerase sigma factor (TIGR02999 family)
VLVEFNVYVKLADMHNRLQQLQPTEITALISKASVGDTTALDDLIPLVYDDLKAIAAGLRHKQFDVSKTINTTSLVNEAWLKLNKYGVKAESRKHFFCIISKAMRQILMNSAKQKMANKRNAQIVTFDEASIESHSEAQWMISLDEIINSIEDANPRMAQVFELKYFLGFTEDEICDALSLSKRSVSRDWLSVKTIIKQIYQKTTL